MTVVGHKRIEIKSSNSIFSFQTTGGGSWKVWDRFLTIEQKKAFHIGNICGTCNFFFERLEGANQKISPKNIIGSLANSRISIASEDFLEIERLFPVGKYLVLNTRVSPHFARIASKDDYFQNEVITTWGVDGFWGIPHNPKIHYYRENDILIDDRRKIFIFLIPLVPENWLDEETLNEYEVRFNNGKTPTAIAVSHLDIKEPASWEEGHRKFNCRRE